MNKHSSEKSSLLIAIIVLGLMGTGIVLWISSGQAEPDGRPEQARAAPDGAGADGVGARSEASRQHADPVLEAMEPPTDQESSPLVRIEIQPSPEATNENAWRLEREAWTPEQLLAEAATIGEDLRTLTAPIFEHRFSTGQYDVIGEGDKYPASDWDPAKLQQVRMGGEVAPLIIKCTLTPEEFPELYAMKARQDWLTERADELDRAAILARRPDPGPR